jgi:hypothetical protein
MDVIGASLIATIAVATIICYLVAVTICLLILFLGYIIGDQHGHMDIGFFIGLLIDLWLVIFFIYAF